jgi:hypothetical protein
MKFSHRFNYDPARQAGPIMEDAPDWLRKEYFLRIVEKLTYIDLDSRQKNEENRPLGIKRLNERLSIESKREMQNDDWDSWTCNDGLLATLMSGTWYQFYDCVEVVGELLREAESKYRTYDETSELFSTFREYEPFKFLAYRDAVNSLFNKHNVIWRLNAQGNLENALPKDLSSRIEALEAKLRDEFTPARVHFNKARTYVLGTHKDPENSIKESVSALESVCRVFYPKASSLGKALGQMRSDGTAPARLITAFERFYEYANDEPGVRHGARHTPTAHLLDAELSLHLAVALIRYIIETKKNSKFAQSDAKK